MKKLILAVALVLMTGVSIAMADVRIYLDSGHDHRCYNGAPYGYHKYGYKYKWNDGYGRGGFKYGYRNDHHGYRWKWGYKYGY